MTISFLHNGSLDPIAHMGILGYPPNATFPTRNSRPYQRYINHHGSLNNPTSSGNTFGGGWAPYIPMTASNEKMGLMGNKVPQRIRMGNELNLSRNQCLDNSKDLPFVIGGLLYDQLEIFYHRSWFRANFLQESSCVWRGRL